MVLIKNNKGIFFTIFVIIVLSLFVLSFTFFASVDQRKTTQERITTLNNFVFSIEKDLPRKLNIATFRIIFLLEKRIIETGSFYTDINSVFEEAFYNGTIQGTTNEEIETLMQGAIFSDIVSSIQEKANKIGATVEISNPKISLIQQDPWNIKLNLNTNLKIKDLNNLALWNKTANFSTLVSIQNFEDPLYIINTNGLVTNKIIKSPYIIFVMNTNIANLSDHFINSYYINSSDAPSFLNRFEGQISPNPNGIESLVNLQKLSSQGLSTLDKSVVDHIYFSSNPGIACNVQPPGMPNYFKLDNNHLQTYQVLCES